MQICVHSILNRSVCVFVNRLGMLTTPLMDDMDLKPWVQYDTCESIRDSLLSVMLGVTRIGMSWGVNVSELFAFVINIHGLRYSWDLSLISHLSHFVTFCHILSSQWCVLTTSDVNVIVIVKTMLKNNKLIGLWFVIARLELFTFFGTHFHNIIS